MSEIIKKSKQLQYLEYLEVCFSDSHATSRNCVPCWKCSRDPSSYYLLIAAALMFLFRLLVLCKAMYICYPMVLTSRPVLAVWCLILAVWWIWNCRDEKEMALLILLDCALFVHFCVCTCIWSCVYAHFRTRRRLELSGVACQAVTTRTNHCLG